MNSRVLALLVSLGALLTLAACGGGGMTIKVPSQFTISASVTGLTGTGLVLQDNGADNLTISSNGTFPFATTITANGTYAVTVLTQPSGQTCSPGSNASGSATGNVTVTVTCSSNTFTIGGTITGLTATGLVLQDNGGDNLTVASGATSFTFATPLAAGAAYAVTVLTQPSGETCSITANGSGTANANVTNVAVTCSSNAFTIGGTITGLTASGLVLQDNGGDNLSLLSSSTSFTFATPLASGAAYNVTVLTQPTGETCTVNAGTGTVANANVTNVVVSCTATSNTFTIGGTITGLTASGLVLQNNGGDNLTVSSGATAFTFATPVAAGATYNVTVLTQPSGQTCSVTANGTGTANADVTNVAVTCGASTFTIGGTIVNLTGTGLVLQDNGGDNLTVAAGATSFTFLTPVAAGSTYNVTVLSQPVGQVCTVGNATGTANADVTSVSVTCTVTALTISVDVSGLTGTGLVFQDNGADNLSVAANGTFTFANGIAPGGPYSVTILTQPAGQTCSLGSNATGVATANVIVNVACSATLYTVSVSVSGLTGTGLVFQDNLADNLSVTANGTFPFATKIASGGAYSVTILTQPTGQTCTLGSNASGTATANVTVAVTCVAGLFNINVSVTGLTGTVVFQDNATDNLTVTTNGTFPFATQIASGSAYAVTILTQPSGQTCTLGSNATGTVNGADVTVTVTCGAAATFQITVTASGLTGTLIVQDDQSETLNFTTNNSQTFPHLYPGGSTYSVTVTSQPSGQNCTLSSNASGTINANTTVTATCVTSVNAGEWTWINGQNIVAVGGIYTNPAEPGTRYASATWQDASGNFWLFGGIGYDSQGPVAGKTSGGSNESVLSDLWEFDGTKWTFKGGQQLTGQCFDFPTGGIGQTGSPSARSDALSWTDLSGNFFMFGGYEDYNQTAFCPTADAFNDLWEYSVSANTWTWVGGSSIQQTKGTYNGIGLTGTPGARYWSTGARDSNGNFWMFGGYAYDSTGTGIGYINDLWMWNGTTWTWLSGSSTNGKKGVYGTMGTAGSNNVPGSRAGANSWIDSSGNFWLFGGVGWDSAGQTEGGMNDLWMFNTSTSQWTWVAGSKTASGAIASYGTQGVADPSNVPGGRLWATSWATPSGDVYILGGQQLGGGLLNDLWKYSGGEWTWIAPNMPSDGSQFVNEVGVYGTQGTANSANAPGSREQGMSWTDSGGNLWLFGGFGWGTIANGSATNVHAGTDSLQDLWQFQP
jgi:Galactose oxidase, central domain